MRQHILLTKENQIAEQKRKHKYPAFIWKENNLFFIDI